MLPGVYADADQAASIGCRIRALALADPDAVLTGPVAARLTYWPELPCTIVHCAVSRPRRPQPGYRFTRRAVPPDLVLERAGLRFTAPALTALDLCPELGGEPIDRLLRSRAATLATLHEALLLSPTRRGNLARRQLLLDSRSEPWSEAERRAHRLLRAAGIGGWTANLPVTVAGSLYYVDIAFKEVRVAVEVDGRLHEELGSLFESDRWRQNALVLAGWRVLRFTWAMLQDHPEVVVATIRAALKT